MLFDEEPKIRNVDAAVAEDMMLELEALSKKPTVVPSQLYVPDTVAVT